jgi:nickel/cobalt transporter (NicO) family protein
VNPGAALRRILLLAVVIFSLGLPQHAVAQQPLIPAPGSEAAASDPDGLWQRGLTTLHQTQRDLHRRLATAVRALKAEGGTAAAALIMISLLYGIFHAVGPGHGKAVISAYLLANETQVRRGVLLAFLSSFVQGLSALLLVGALAVVLSMAGVEVTRSVGLLESASYALVALVGAWMLWSSLRGSTHSHGEGAAACGHNHAPHPGMLSSATVEDEAPSGRSGWRGEFPKAAGLVLAVGIRPCSGAVLVLLFALAHGVFLAGVAATFAMSFGAAVTVSALAVLTLFSKRLALAVVGQNARWVERTYRLLGLLGAGLLLVLGVTLFYASLGPAGPL